MRWDKLFDDLESQLERDLASEEADLDVEEERLRIGRLALRDRLVALHDSYDRGAGYRVAVTLVTGERIVVRPLSFGRDWFLADLLSANGSRHAARAVQCILPLEAIRGITLEPDQLLPSLDAPKTVDTLSARLGLPFVLRDLCRRRRAIELVIADGALHGTIDRVGRDHLDLAVHEAGAPRRASAVTEYRIVPLAALVMVRL